MDTKDSQQAFTVKWYAAWPEQHVLNVFVPVHEREVCSAWGALLFELHESLFSLEYDTVREAKSQWWSLELQAMSGNDARHPLTRTLQSRDAPFSGMAASMAELADLVPVKADRTLDIFQTLMPLAQAVSACEAALFGGQSTTVEAQSVIGQWLTMRLPHGLSAFDRAMVPMSLLARHHAMVDDASKPALRRDWLQELNDALINLRPENWYRLAQLRFTLRRIRCFHYRDTPKIGPGHAWDAWRTVRSRRNT